MKLFLLKTIYFHRIGTGEQGNWLEGKKFVNWVLKLDYEM